MNAVPARAVAVRGDPNAPRLANPLNAQGWAAHNAERAAYGAQWKPAGELQYGKPGFVFPPKPAADVEMDGQGRKRRKTRKQKRTSKKRVSKSRKSRRRM